MNWDPNRSFASALGWISYSIAKWKLQSWMEFHHQMVVIYESIHIHPWKPTWYWKIPMFNRKYIFKWWIFPCHVSFQEGTLQQNRDSTNRTLIPHFPTGTPLSFISSANDSQAKSAALGHSSDSLHSNPKAFPGCKTSSKEKPWASFAQAIHFSSAKDRRKPRKPRAKGAEKEHACLLWVYRQIDSW